MKTLPAAGVCVALVAATLVIAAPMAVACPSGTVPTDFSGVCVSGGESGGQPVNGELQAPIGSLGGPAISGGVNGLPSVDGIPCTPQHLGTCIGLAQSQG